MYLKGFFAFSTTYIKTSENKKVNFSEILLFINSILIQLKNRFGIFPKRGFRLKK